MFIMHQPRSQRCFSPFTLNRTFLSLVKVRFSVKARRSPGNEVDHIQDIPTSVDK